MKTGVILARFQPIHNGHLQLIKKACDENEQVLVIIGSIDKLSKRNPIPWSIRKQLVEKAIKDHSLHEKTKIVELADLSDESDNSHDWGFYLYSFIVSKINQSDFTIYYSDGFEIITSWFPGFLLRNPQRFFRGNDYGFRAFDRSGPCGAVKGKRPWGETSFTMQSAAKRGGSIP